MIEFTPAARDRFDGYLQRLRSALRGTSSVHADEVEQSVREHVEVALAGARTPIAPEHLGTVLEQLGPPERWVLDDEKTIWRRVVERMRFGPDDWRLAYAAFALFMLMLLTLPVFGPLFLIPAYLLSRAYVELLRERNESIGPRRWLVYPSIATVLFFIAAALLIGPIALFNAWAVADHGLHRLLGMSLDGPGIVRHTRFDVGVIAMSAGLWWMIVSGLIAALLRPIRFVVAPLIDGVERKHMLGLTLVGAVVAGLGAIVFFA